MTDANGFTGDSENIRDLIRRDEAGQADIQAIRAAVIEAEKSGDPRPFDGSHLGDQWRQNMPTSRAEYRLVPKAKEDLEAVWLTSLCHEAHGGSTATLTACSHTRRYRRSCKIISMRSLPFPGLRRLSRMAPISPVDFRCVPPQGTRANPAISQ